MLEGTYVVLAQTPVGSKRGEVTFSHGVNGALRAVLNVTQGSTKRQGPQYRSLGCPR